MDSFVLLAYASVVASRNLLQQLLACLNFPLESGNLCFWCKQKISMNSGSSTSSWKPWRWVRLPDIFYEEYYTSIPTWHSQNSLAAAAEAPSLKISSHGKSLLLYIHIICMCAFVIWMFIYLKFDFEIDTLWIS